MLVFGPYRAIPIEDSEFAVFNLSSPVQAIERLPGLMVFPDNIQIPNNQEESELYEKSFDMWYYNYVLNDPIACSSLMMILSSLYEGRNVYICIAEYSYGNINILNESFMKLIQTRYDIKYSIINNKEDFMYIQRDGCDFASVSGIKNFDEDRKRYMQIIEAQKIMNGGY